MQAVGEWGFWDQQCDAVGGDQREEIYLKYIKTRTHAHIQFICDFQCAKRIENK